MALPWQVVSLTGAEFRCPRSVHAISGTAVSAAGGYTLLRSVPFSVHPGNALYMLHVTCRTLQLPK